METIVMWVLIAVLQSQGAVGGSWGNQAECEEVKGQMIQAADAIFVSECTAVTLVKKDAVAK